MSAVRAGGSRCDKRFVIPEGGFIIQIEIIVADLRPCLAAFAETVVEGSVQMVVRFPDLDDVPGMAGVVVIFRAFAVPRVLVSVPYILLPAPPNVLDILCRLFP